MVFKREEYYFNGKKVLKQTLSKYINWAAVLSAIKNGADDSVSIQERLGMGAKFMLVPLKKEGLCVASSSTRVATYTVTPKGEQLINEIKQYQKEKKNEKI